MSCDPERGPYSSSFEFAGVLLVYAALAVVGVGGSWLVVEVAVDIQDALAGAAL